MSMQTKEMWRAVIERAALDLQGKKLCPEDDPVLVRCEVRAWLATEDFEETCIMAGLDHHAVLQRMRNLG